jgi:hypothetical protein
MMRIIRIVLIAGAVTVAGTTAAVAIRDYQFRTAYAAIAAGMPASEVEKRVGSPSFIFACGAHGEAPPAGCMKEYSYQRFPEIVEEWIVYFDARNRVIRKARFVSP